MTQIMTDLFILSLPPINLHTANLLLPYYNGVEAIRASGSIKQASGYVHTNNINNKARELLNSHNGYRINQG